MREGEDFQLCWIGGAGYLLRYQGIMAAIDPYLSDSCFCRTGRLKRITPPPFKAEDLRLDYIFVTHTHCDHLDEESIPLLISCNPKVKIVGPQPVVERSLALGATSDQTLLLTSGNSWIPQDGISITAIPCDHGPDPSFAVGFLIQLGKHHLYHTSDMHYREDFLSFTGLSPGAVDIAIVPINGTYGNPDPDQASLMIAALKPQKAIPTHFWLFVEHGGNPARFAEACNKTCNDVKVLIPTIGQYITL